jgi:hypothetical protein
LSNGATSGLAQAALPSRHFVLLAQFLKIVPSSLGS